MKRCIVLSLISLTGMLLLTACQGRERPNRDFHGRAYESSGPCVRNPYLQRFDCSLQRVQEAAIGGDPDAQYALGYMYFYGIGTVSDAETGILWIKKSAAQGQPLAKKALLLLAHPKTGDRVPRHHKLEAQPDAVPPATAPASQSASPTRTSTSHLGKAHQSVLMRVPASRYTIQLLATPHHAEVGDFMVLHHLSKTQVAVYAAQRRGQTWYRVIYGRYHSAQHAHRALRHLPPHLKRLHPWVKSFARVHHEIQQGG